MKLHIIIDEVAIRTLETDKRCSKFSYYNLPTEFQDIIREFFLAVAPDYAAVTVKFEEG